jgi:hypothetical protein
VLNQAWDQGFARLAIKFIGSHIPEKQTLLPWLTQRRLLQHAMTYPYPLRKSPSITQRIYGSRWAGRGNSTAGVEMGWLAKCCEVVMGCGVVDSVL